MRALLFICLTMLVACDDGGCERADLRNELCTTWTCAEPMHPVIVHIGEYPGLCVCVPPEEMGQ